MSAPAYPLTIYYDASCPLCATELQTLCEYAGEQRLRLVDCSVPGFADAAAAAAGLDSTELMRTIYARDANGRWLGGIDVFVPAYDAAGVAAVARLYSHPRLRPLWDRVYPWIARHRMALSRLGLHRAFGWLVRRTARRAEQRRVGCSRRDCRS